MKMGLENRLTDDLVRIASAGGGFQLNVATRMTDDLVRIAAAAKIGECQVIFTGMETRMTNDLVRIASAAQGHVIFG